MPLSRDLGRKLKQILLAEMAVKVKSVSRIITLGKPGEMRTLSQIDTVDISA